MDCLLVVGLGNPGLKYENNRHNVGFNVVEALVRRFCGSASCGFQKVQSVAAEVAAFSISDRKVLLLKPLTYMNLSGQAVSSIMNFYKLSLSDLFVFHDDIDLDFLRIKCKIGGGAGGHNGLKSINSCVGKDYCRIRIGVGRPEIKEMVSSYVLQDFSKSEMLSITGLIDDIVDNFEVLIRDYSLFCSNIISKKGSGSIKQAKQTNGA